MNDEERIVPMRLQRFLARAGVASRRGSEDLMTAGRVTVNGETVMQLGSKVDPLKDVVAVDGKVVSFSKGPVTIALHKPAGIICTMKSQSERPCVADIVPIDTYPGLFPIGRLDADTTGLLLFSTDGNLGHGLLHPSHHVWKTYLACVFGVPNDQDIERLRKGIELDDGMSQPAEAEMLSAEESRAMRGVFAMPSTYAKKNAQRREARVREATEEYSVLRITIHEGRYHQVKRMCEAIGHPVAALHRVSFGPIELGDLERGSWRILDPEEVSFLNEQASYGNKGKETR